MLRVVGPPFSGVVQQTGTSPDPATLLELFTDGSVTAYSGKVEYGQGIRNGFVRMIAAALDRDASQVEVILGDTARVPFDRGTTGSASTRPVGVQLVKAAEAARNELGKRLASRGEGSRVASLEALIDPDNLEIDISGGAENGSTFLESLPSYTESARIDGAERATGGAVYAHDFSLEGAAHGRVIRPPAAGAKLLRLDSARAEQVAGFISLVNVGGLIGVVAETREAAERAASYVRTSWEEPNDDVSDWNFPAALKDRASEPVVLRSDGNIEAGLAGAARIVLGVYYAPYVANAQMEPSAATAQWDADGNLTVWCANRAPFTERANLAQSLGVDLESIRVITLEVGGSFGTKSQSVSIEAAVLARESGRAVKVAYSRAEEFATSTVRPAALMEISSGVDSAGKLVAWDYLAFHAGDNAFRGRRGADSAYDAQATRIRVADSPSPLAHGSYRSLGGAVNHFSREVHIDVIARELEIDPLEFRLANLSHLRYRRVLETVAEMSGWNSRSKTTGVGFGVAVGFDAGSYVAQVARVRVENGTVRVESVDVAFDCGQVFNPEGARNQIEGSIVMGLGTALWEAVEFDGGRVLSTGFATYRVPRISDLPMINVKLIDDRSNEPSGAGEPGIVADRGCDSQCCDRCHGSAHRPTAD
ncbi:MAG: molybdopterin-dependent oxidoreductase [Chloroflexi bacterium]|nr:molybdopterin-dependent oxidoreductase [Chloroflexota bacterium]